MTNEPRLDAALQMLMEMLDGPNGEVTRVLVNTSFRQLDADAVAEAEELLNRPTPDSLQEALDTAREKARDALYEWLEAKAHWMREH